jgi:serine palmitoyltransferase
MLFPAVHELGYKAGQACYDLLHASHDNTLPTLTEVWQFMTEFPTIYKTWWLNLVENDPLHVAIETTLIISIIYMLVSRNTEGYKNTRDGKESDRLTPQEQEELLWEWKNQLRSPLAPPSLVPSSSASSPRDSRYGRSSCYDDDLQIVVQKQEGKWLTITTNNNTITPIETNNKEASSVPSSSAAAACSAEAPTTTTAKSTVVAGIIGGKKRLNSKKNNSSSNNKKSVQLPPPSDAEVVEARTATPATTTTTTNPVQLKVMNFCNFDFLGLQTSDVIRDASTAALNKYGCGSCGPRGFYGTIDTHLQLEDAISTFTHTDNAIMYSDGASTCSSTVAAFAKRGDVLVVDEGVYEPITTGVTLSRANVHWFKHNDMEDLERVLRELQATDKRLKRKPNAQRRFIVVEGLYKNIGSIAPIDKIVELKHKYHYRLMLDESFSFGCLGGTGRGVLELYNKKPMYDAEIITIALENSLGSIGGVTVGNEEVVDHQRLSGAGYCFSASAPPFTASAAIAALRYMESQPHVITKLQSNVKYMYQQLEQQLTKRQPKLVLTSDERSPIVVLQLERESTYEASIMNGIMQECLRRGIAIVATGQDASSHLRTELAPCIRLTVSTLHSHDDIDNAIEVLIESSDLVLSQFPSL